MTTPFEQREVGLVDLLDSALDTGVVLWGDALITLADVDLAYLGIKLMLSSTETANRMRAQAGLPPLALPSTSGRRDTPLLRGASEHMPAAAPTLPSPHIPSAQPNVLPAATPQAAAPTIAPEELERGLAKLTLTIIELLRQLMERQATRRVERGDLSDEAIERLGLTLMGLETRMQELRQIFGFSDADLNLDLGPLGKLL